MGNLQKLWLDRNKVIDKRCISWLRSHMIKVNGDKSAMRKDDNGNNLI
jgi:hypothetical protein